jgi:hypothetical protein
MRHQSGEAEERKNWRKLNAERRKTGFKKTESDIKDIVPDIMDAEIDPAEFFDPEEFGVRRHFEPFRP